MKYFVITLFFVGLVGSASAQYMGGSQESGLIWPPVCIGIHCLSSDEVIKNVFSSAISEPFDQSDSVIVGTVIQKENKDKHITYSINVDFYLKNKQSFDLITATLNDATEPATFPEVLYYNSPVFNEGDLVFVYLKKTDGVYTILPQSFALDKHEPRGPPPDILLTTSPRNDKFAQGDEITVSGQVRKAELYYSAKKGESLDVKLTILDEQRKPVQSNRINIDSNGNFQYVLQTLNLPPGQYDLDINYGPETTSPRVTLEPNLKYWTPLKQIKSGIPVDEIQCTENLVLIQKYDGSPACVKPDTKEKMIERGWIKDHSNKITFEDYMVDCNNKMNPYEEYECFKDALSSCKMATVNPEIYTIEGDAVYTTLEITPDCKIKGIADMSTDRFWGHPEIITAVCSTIDRDEYMWVVKDCDAEKLPEIQFNFEMQLYPKILECEENGNTWSRETLSCITKHSSSGESIWKKYITVSASRIDKSNLEDILDIIKLENSPQNDLLDLLVGADGCKNETEICKISGGISLDRTYSFLSSSLRVSDNDMYSVTLTPTQADNIFSVLDWTRNENSFYVVIQWDEKYYLLELSTFDNSKTPDVKMNIIGTSYEPVSLKRGEILNYTIQINTWATYGDSAKIDLSAIQDTKDSGITVWVEPKIVFIPERSNATTTLFIQAQDDAKDGIYDIRVIGYANEKLANLYCRNTTCPTIKIGDSDWAIRTFGSGTNMGIGGGQHPENTWMELELNKNEFFEGDMVEIRAYMINNSTEKITVVPDNLLIKVIKAQPVGYYENLYGIDARYESDKPIVLEPGSKTLLARPFYWNQNTFQNLDDEQRVEPREHKMIATFVAGSNAWSDDIWFGIK
ncbi:MAG: hypothetical protein K8Q89_05595 [Nitrosarchaeum sp.]|nr:hypothetical protein [Nitrosarchaeum sp.]